jgi:ADP-ribose pyrophosphatase YjhB (NUDIX family)
MNSSDTAYFRPITTVDLVIFALSAEGLEVLTLRRTEDPFAGRWALPGGSVHVDEDADLEAAARRLLRGKTGVTAPDLEQLQKFGNAKRVPRGWTISVSYVALLSGDDAGAMQQRRRAGCGVAAHRRRHEPRGPGVRSCRNPRGGAFADT